MVVSQLMDMRKATERRRAHDCHNQSASLAALGMGWASSAEEDSCKIVSPAWHMETAQMTSDTAR